MRITTRALLVAVAVVGFDAAAISRAIHQGRASHAVVEYVVGFGLVLLVLNVVVVALLVALARQRARSPKQGLLSLTPSPLMIAGFYVMVLAIAILSVLFLSSGRF